MSAILGPAVRRVVAGAALVVVGGLGLGVQSLRRVPGTDQFGTVAYVVALALLIMLLGPRLRPWLVAVLAAAVAIGVEYVQLTGVPAALGRTVPTLRYVLGTSFSTGDVAWSLVGGVAAWAVARLLRIDVLPRRHWTRGAVMVTLAAVALLIAAALPLARDGIGYGHDVPWLPVAAVLVLLVVGLVETWRGLSRTDRRLSPAELATRSAIGIGVAVVVSGWGRGAVTAAERSTTTAPLAVAVVEILVLAAVLALVAGWGRGAPQRGPSTIAFLAALLAVVLAGAVPGHRPAPTTAIPTSVPPAQPLVTSRAPAPATVATGTTPPAAPPAAPDAAGTVPLCRVEQLSAGTQGWDAAMGKTWVSVVVRNTATSDCAVSGLPDISLLQGTAPLPLTTSRESVQVPGGTVQPRRALVRAGGAVSVLLWWPGYRSAADRTTPQALTLHAPGVGSLPVSLDQGPAPFDLVGGGLVRVSGWI